MMNKLIKGRLTAKSGKSSDTQVKPLPGKTSILPGKEFAIELKTARELLGVSVQAGPVVDGQEMAVVKSEGGKYWHSIAYHHSSVFINGSPLELAQAFAHAMDFTLLIRAVSQDSESFVKHIQREKESCINSNARIEFLDDVLDWAFPKHTRTVFGHDLLIWGLMRQILPVQREETAGLNGKYISYAQAGSVARSVIYGLPMDMSDTPRDLVSDVTDPVWYAAPRSVLWFQRYYVLPDVNMAYAFWSGVVTPENISQLLELGDLLMHAEQVQQLMYSTAIIRVAVPYVNRKADFSVPAASLSKLGKWEQRNGTDLRIAFKSFIPGSDPATSWHRHVVRTPVATLKTAANALRSVGDRNATNMMGTIDEQAFILNPKIRPGRFYDGPSKAGKSTLAAVHANQETSNIVWMPLTAGQFEGATRWAKEFGGTVISLNLPDAYATMENDHEKVNPEVVQAKQREIHALDKEDAEGTVRGLEAKWYEHEKIVGLPLTFDIVSGDTVRLFNWYAHFLNEWRQVWSRWYERTGEQSVLVADNLSALRLSGDDPLLGRIPEATGRNLGLSLAWYVSNGRNIGTVCWILSHSVEDLDYISTGLYHQIGLHVSLKDNDYSMAKILQPKEREVLVPQLYIRLSQRLRTRFERREPTEQGVPWMQKASYVAP